jgi:class 3 adenylate cyclase
MRSTSEELSRWLLHVSGQTELPRVLTPLREAIELNREGPRIISTFGQQRFEAMVGFVDMRGFSCLARGLSPEEVRDIATPFVGAVVEAARRNHCFIDKTIGDEVMLLMPSFGEDVALANVGLEVRDPWPVTLSALVADITRLIDDRAPRRCFSAGFAFGALVLGHVGADGYGEWTVYGNAVNAAKRLQALAGELSPEKERNSLAVGVIEGELGPWFAREFDVKIWQQVGPISLTATKSGNQPCKGVGEVRYIAADVSLRV